MDFLLNCAVMHFDCSLTQSIFEYFLLVSWRYC